MMKVVGSGQALQDERRWVVKLECGHEVVVVSTSRPTSAECDQCRTVCEPCPDCKACRAGDATCRACGHDGCICKPLRPREG